MLPTGEDKVDETVLFQLTSRALSPFLNDAHVKHSQQCTLSEL